MGRVQNANTGEEERNGWKKIILPLDLVPFSFRFFLRTNEKGCFFGHPCFIVVVIIFENNDPFSESFKKNNDFLSLYHERVSSRDHQAGLLHAISPI